MLTLIVRIYYFCKINFCSCHRLQKYSYNENFQIYGSTCTCKDHPCHKNMKIEACWTISHAELLSLFFFFFAIIFLYAYLRSLVKLRPIPSAASSQLLRVNVHTAFSRYRLSTETTGWSTSSWSKQTYLYLIFPNLEKLCEWCNKPAVVANNFVGDVYKRSSWSECSARIIPIWELASKLKS